MKKEAIKVQEGAIIEYTVSVPVSNGDVIPLEDRVVIALDSGVSGDIISVATEGVFEIQAKQDDAFKIGTVAYFDKTKREITTESSNNVIAGIATSVKVAETVGTVNVKMGTAVAPAAQIPFQS